MAKIMLGTPVENTEFVSDQIASPEAAAAKTEEFEQMPASVKSEDSEPKSALAVGLPAAWSIEPPAMGVRRKARAL